MKTKLLLMCFIVPIMALSQINQIGQDIDGEEEFDQSGWSVSTSPDGSIVAIGAIYNDGNGPDSGHVRVFENSEGVWTQIGTDIDGEAANDRSGWSVSLNDDSTIIAIGAIDNDGNGVSSGHVRIYQNVEGVWSQVGADIDGEATNDQSGWSVSLSADGNIVAVGARFNDSNGLDSGHVRVYQYIGGNWIQVGDDINGEAIEDYFGDSVSLSANGNVVAIGAPGNNTNGIDSGQVRIFRNIGGVWTQIGEAIYGKEPGDGCGVSVSLSANGDTVAVGSNLNSDNGSASGQVRVYQNVADSWVQIGADINGEAENDQSGWPISLSANGRIVAIGAVWNNGNGLGSGQVRVYQNLDGNWIQIGTDIDGEAEGDHSGCAISLNTDGNIVAIGAIWNSDNGMASGQTRVFNLSGAMGVEESSPIHFIVYPSPTTGILNIESINSVTQIEIYNPFGQLLMTKSNQITLDISGVSQGIYFVRIMDEVGNIGTQKIIKR